MPRIPILGRLKPRDYGTLLITLVIFIFEGILRLLGSLLPASFIKKRNDIKAETKFNTTEDFVIRWGYPFQEHVVVTEDDYMLTLHRIPSASPTTPTQKDLENNSNGTFKYLEDVTPKPVILLWHGFLMNSEVFVCRPKRLENVAFWLAEQGYDVWLGNNRGNKYSHKHRQKSPSSREFWDFSLDEFAMYDMPNSIDYILKVTKAPNLTYIGFSQGTAQSFASLSIRPDLNKKVNLFVCLAPALAPPGLESNIVNTIVGAYPNLLYLIFGRKEALSACLFWQSVLPTWLFVKAIDSSMHFLFGWKTANLSNETKRGCYPHLYSMTSVKCLVHWFQIIRTSRFQLYDDVSGASTLTSKGHVVTPYPTSQIQAPIAIFYGESDSLCDSEKLKASLPTPAFSLAVPHYEHLDFLWADDLPTTVLPSLEKLLLEFIGPSPHLVAKTITS